MRRDATQEPRVVFVHDWLTGMRGGEKCLEALVRSWTNSRLATLIHKPGSVSSAIENLKPLTSILQYLPGVPHYYRYLLPLMPAAMELLRLPRADLVVSLSHCAAKAVKPPRGVPHLCYCFTPMRYAWHMRDSYFQGRASTVAAQALDGVLRLLREWDRRCADRVTHFVAISETVKKRIFECYGRSSKVIYPPVNTDFYTPASSRREDYYLIVSAFAPYKRIDLAIDACQRLNRHLVVIGNGQDEARLRARGGHRVQFLGWQPDTVVRDHLQRCRALLFPGEEDFGIVPVEAMSCGAPVIAYGRGGATETVVPRTSRREPTGVWFEEQTTECLVSALEEFERHSGEFSPSVLRRQALRFQERRFLDEMTSYREEILGRRPALRLAA